MSTKHQIRIGSKEVTVTNPDKIFYPSTSFNKGAMIDYYQQIAPVLQPHLKGRAITLKRYPDGVAGNFFYEKQCPSHAPSWLKTTPVEKADGTMIQYCMIHDLPSLVWAANIANLEFHPFLHRATSPSKPTSLVFDLDPGPPADVLNCCQVALRIHDLFHSLGLEIFIKTSGSKGLQLMVPLNGGAAYGQTKSFAHSVAEALAFKFPKEVTADMKKSLRTGKVLIDWSQNDAKKTTVSAYSLRAMDEPLVSTPLTWLEVESALHQKSLSRLRFAARDVIKRVAKTGDLFEETLKLKQNLPKVEFRGAD